MRRAQLPRGGSWVLALGLGFASCSSEQVVPLELPPAPSGARTAFLAHEPNALWLIDLEQPRDLPVLPDVAQTLTVAFYAEPASAFGHAPGPVPRATADEPAFGLPDARAWQTTLDAQLTAPAWTELPELPPVLAQRRVPGTRSACRPFEIRVFPLTTDEDPNALMRHPDGVSVIVGLEGLRSVRASAEGLEPMPGLDGRPVLSGVTTPDDVVWTFGNFGSVQRGPIDGVVVDIPPAPHRDSIHVAVLDERSGRPLIQTVSQFGFVATLDPATGTWGPTLTERGVEDDNYGRDLALVGDSGLLSCTRQSPDIVRIERGIVRRERPEPNNTAGIHALLEVPGMGTFAASAFNGQLFLHRNGAWRTIDGAILGLAVFAIVADGPNIYAVGARGGFLGLVWLGEDRFEVCKYPPQATGVLEGAFVVQPGVLAVTTTPDLEDTTPAVVWMIRQDAPRL